MKKLKSALNCCLDVIEDEETLKDEQDLESLKAMRELIK